MSFYPAFTYIDSAGHERQVTLPPAPTAAADDDPSPPPVAFADINWDTATHVWVHLPASCYDDYPPRQPLHGRVCRVFVSLNRYRVGVYLEGLTKKHRVLVFNDTGIDTILSLRRRSFEFRVGPDQWAYLDDLPHRIHMAPNIVTLRTDYHVGEPTTVTAMLAPDHISTALQTLGVAMRAMGLSTFPSTWQQQIEHVAATTGNDESQEPRT